MVLVRFATNDFPFCCKFGFVGPFTVHGALLGVVTSKFIVFKNAQRYPHPVVVFERRTGKISVPKRHF